MIFKQWVSTISMEDDQSLKREGANESGDSAAKRPCVRYHDSENKEIMMKMKEKIIEIQCNPFLNSLTNLMRRICIREVFLHYVYENIIMWI
jgi:hypothetical protein